MDLDAYLEKRRVGYTLVKIYIEERRVYVKGLFK